jgi:hypothetical protein
LKSRKLVELFLRGKLTRGGDYKTFHVGVGACRKLVGKHATDNWRRALKSWRGVSNVGDEAKNPGAGTKFPGAGIKKWARYLKGWSKKQHLDYQQNLNQGGPDRGLGENYPFRHR